MGKAQVSRSGLGHRAEPRLTRSPEREGRPEEEGTPKETDVRGAEKDPGKLAGPGNKCCKCGSVGGV